MSSAASSTAATPSLPPRGVWQTKFFQVYMKTTFGPLVQCVTDCLLSRGSMTLEELYRHSGLDVPTIKRCLLTLIQQDMVLPQYEVIHTRPTGTAAEVTAGTAAAAATKKKSTRKPRVFYHLQFDTIRHRCRFSSYLLWVRQRFGIEHEYLLQTLLLHGKLTARQVIDITCASIEERNRLAAQEKHKAYLAQLAAHAQQVAAASSNAGAAAALPPPPPPPQQPLPPLHIQQQDRLRIGNILRELISSKYVRRATTLTSSSTDPSSSSAAAAAAPTSSSNLVDGGLLSTFLASNAAAASTIRAREETHAAAAKAEEEAQAAAAALPEGAKSRKRKKINEDDSAAAAADAAEGEQPKKRAKKPTKKELAALAAEQEKLKQEEAKMRSEAEAAAKAERATAAAIAGTTDSSAAAAAGMPLPSSSPSSTGEGDDVVWVVNHAQLLWEFRKRAVIDFVATTVAPGNAAAAFLVAQMIHAYPPLTRSAATDNESFADTVNRGEPIPIFSAIELVGLCTRAAHLQQCANPIADADAAEEVIHELLGHNSGFFEHKTYPKAGYAVDFNALFQCIRQQHLHSSCRDRFGPLAARIFRCLLRHRRLEETQIAEYCVAPRKDVRKTLYAMHQARYLHIQEVPRSSDRMPSRTFYLWGVQLKQLEESFVESLYFSWCNLRLRLELETDQAKPLIDKVDTSRIISPDEKVAIERWKKSADRLEAAIIQLNQLISTFQDC